jgi:hypothetical protein
MKIRRCALALSIAAMLSGGAQAVLADDAAALSGEIRTMDRGASVKGGGAVTGKIAADFESFAGSSENATALVSGLRSGSEVILTQPGEPTVSFVPATKPMGYGNVSTSLALARYQLAQQDIANPTPLQLATALNGGTITVDGRTVEYAGVLQMRADGQGWGQIAHRLGTNLGPVVSGIKSQNVYISTLPTARHATTALPTRVTTAAGAQGGMAAANRHGAGGGKGIVTASGVSAAHVAGKGKADGVITAGGPSTPPSRGQGIVTAAGTGASPVAHGVGHGKAGVVTASGVSATTSSGAGQGHGKALGHTK